MESMSKLAQQAADDTHARFGRRVFGLPGTWIGSTYSHTHSLRDGSRLSDLNGPRHPLREWNYWWQAHYLDAIIDAGLEYLQANDESAAHVELKRANSLLRGIQLRNFGVLPNYFYDDMAWLALASQRLLAFNRELNGQTNHHARFAVQVLGNQLRRGIDEALGGGLYWSRKRDFKNTPANAPAALFFARTGEKELARQLLAWLRQNLFSDSRGVYLDGIRLATDGPKLEAAVYTYNQGPVLGALLELGEEADLAHAATLVASTEREISNEAKILKFNSGGDGNLFAGILCRYLSLAAQDTRLGSGTRETACKLISETADQLRDEEPRRLSAAVQRWMILSAAANCEVSPKDN